MKGKPVEEFKEHHKSPFTLIGLIFEWNILLISLSGGYGVYNKAQAAGVRFKVKADRIAVEEVNRIMELQDIAERESRLWSLRRDLDSFLDSLHEKAKAISYG